MKLLNWIVQWGEPGCYLPRTHGFVFHDRARRRSLCLPVPFNIPARVLWLLWCWMKNPLRDGLHEGKSEEGACRLCCRRCDPSYVAWQGRAGQLCGDCVWSIITNRSEVVTRETP